jgi:SAM-dependent methyltransferase
MAFPCEQHRHDLIPRSGSGEEEAAIAAAIGDFRVEVLALFQRRIEALAAEVSPEHSQGLRWMEIRRQLDACEEIRAANARRQQLQDRLWAIVGGAVEKDRQRLETVFRSRQRGLGTLELKPDLVPPAHQLRTDIHRMPGGYLQDEDGEGFHTGALYDHGVFLYGRGWLGPLNDELGQTLLHEVLAPQYPGRQPRRILDMGCSVGHSTLPYSEAFPEAELWGIDLGASLLRYAIARSRLLGREVHFAQQDAERTDFTDRSFDLIVSHLLLHEIPGAARRRLFAECHRLLRPGGLMVHLDSALFLRPPTAAGRYYRDTEVTANAEPFLGSSRFEEFPAYALAAGFSPEAFRIHAVPGHLARARGQARPAWLAFCGEKC